MKRRLSARMAFAILFCFCMLTGCGAQTVLAPAETTTPDPLALGAQMEAAGETDQAVAAYREAYERDPRQTDLLRKLLLLCAQETDAGRTDYTEPLIALYEDLYASDQMTDEELLALCERYRAHGESAKMCVLLERAQRLSPDPARQALLDGLVIDPASLEETAQELLRPVLDALAAQDADAAAPLLLDGRLFGALRSTMRGGTRRYGCADDDGQTRIEAAFDAAGNPVLRLWRLRKNGEAAVIRKESGVLSVTKAGYKDGAYNGAFTSAYYEAATGSTFVDTGTFTNDLLTGEFSTKACFGTEAATLDALWKNRASVQTVLYTGAFDESGHATAAQQSNVKSTGVIYAYQADDAAKFIYVLDPDALGSAGYVFDYGDVGVDLMPSW